MYSISLLYDYFEYCTSGSFRIFDYYYVTSRIFCMCIKYADSNHSFGI